jgi:hypothetical protein
MRPGVAAVFAAYILGRHKRRQRRRMIDGSGSGKGDD